MQGTGVSVGLTISCGLSWLFDSSESSNFSSLYF